MPVCHAARRIWPPALALLVATLAHGGGDLGSTPQLLLNPGFEQGTGDGAADWGLWPPTGTEAGVSSLRDAQVKHAGSHSARLEVTRDEFQGICTWHHPAVPVQAGQELVLAFSMRAEGVVDRCGCDVQLRQGPRDIVGGAGTEATRGTFDWRQVTHRFTVPEGVDCVCVVPYLYGKGTVWFDDVMLYGTPTLRPLRVNTPPRIEGDLSDPCWKAEDAVGGFALADGSGLPERATSVWAASDADSLYLAFRCQKKPGDKLKKTVTKRDGTVWADDDVEVFLNPQGDRGNYYQFAVNALGTRYDSHGTDASWSAEWLARARDGTDAWTVEIAIPITALPIDLTVGRAWCANFGRADTLARQASAWSCPFGGFHSPARFGNLADLDLDLVPFYERDARVRIAAVQQAYESAVADLDVETAPAAIAAPFRERDPAIRAGLARLKLLVQNPSAASAAEWQQVRAQAAALSAQITALRAASMRLRAHSLWREAATPQPRFGLATAPAMVKVRKDGADFAGHVARALSLSAARNDYESAQVIAVSLSDQDIPDWRAEVTRLDGPNGAVIGKDNLTLGIVGYVKTGKPAYETTYVGDWPDPIMPLAPFALKARELQPIWLRVYVPPATRAGDYRGTLTVTGGGESRKMALKLHVFDFDLPRRQHLATPFGCDPGSLSQWYTGSRDYEANLPPEVFTRWNRFMLDYRLTPTHVGSSYIKEVRNGKGQATYDYSIMDRCVAALADRLPPDGVGMASIGNVGWAASNGARCAPFEGDAHGGERSGKTIWPEIDSWAALDHPMPGAWIAERGCRAFRFWIKSLGPSFEQESIVAFVNAFPNRWVTSFPVGGTEWHEVRIPVEQYHHNTTGEPLTLAALKTCNDFQFVIAKKDRVIEYLVDDVVAECADGEVVIDDFERKTELAAVQSQMGAHLKHWRNKGWFGLGHVYAKDEIRPEEYDTIIPAYRRALEIAPNAPLMQTYYMNRTPRELIGAIRIWCAITSVYDEGFLSTRRKAGEKTWLYVCCGPQPPFANFLIDQPGIDHRVLFWQTWQHDCTGLLYWETDYWYGMAPLKPGDRRWPEVPWDQEKHGTYRDYKVNGDGFLIYPGPNWTPIPSVRLENIRDGIEDYEYLWLLRQRRPTSPLLAVGEDISKDFTHFCKDPAVVEARRLAIARAIEKAAPKAAGARP